MKNIMKYLFIDNKIQKREFSSLILKQSKKQKLRILLEVILKRILNRKMKIFLILMAIVTLKSLLIKFISRLFVIIHNNYTLE